MTNKTNNWQASSISNLFHTLRENWSSKNKVQSRKLEIRVNLDAFWWFKLFYSEPKNEPRSNFRSTASRVSKYGVISGPYFPVYSPNTGKYGPEITPYLDTFHAVIVCETLIHTKKYSDKINWYLKKRNIENKVVSSPSLNIDDATNLKT